MAFLSEHLFYRKSFHVQGYYVVVCVMWFWMCVETGERPYELPYPTYFITIHPIFINGISPKRIKCH